MKKIIIIVFFYLMVVAIHAQDVIPLKLYRNTARTDNFTTISLGDEEEAKKNGYSYIGIEGYIFSPEYGRTLDKNLVKPLNVYWSEARNDFFTTSIDKSDSNVGRAGYKFVETVGYIYRERQDDTKLLKLYWNAQKDDNFTIASAGSEKEAEAASYSFVENLGYVLINNESISSHSKQAQTDGSKQKGVAASGLNKEKKKKKSFMEWLDGVNAAADKFSAKIDKFDKAVEKILGIEGSSSSENKSANNSVQEKNNKNTGQASKQQDAATNKKQASKSAVTTPEVPASVTLENLKKMPEVKFTANNPCAPNNQAQSGLPWDPTRMEKVKLTSGVEPIIPDKLPDINQLSKFNYNAAVSVAFEGMRLIYGPMPDDEAKKFEQTWTPLFDYPTTEIIDYLNKLNPLISQFLAVRESYMRSLSATQMIMLDAATAIEWDDRQAFESALSEANLHKSALLSLDAAMKELANRIQTLGNPPNPNDAKCEANRRYKKFFGVSDPEGCWAGFEHNIFLSDGGEGIFSESGKKLYGKVFEPYYIYLFKTTSNGKERLFSIQLAYDVNLGSSNLRGNIKSGFFTPHRTREKLYGKTSFSENWLEAPDKLAYFIQKFELPDIPHFDQTSDDQINTWLQITYDNERFPGSDPATSNSFKKMFLIKKLAPQFYETAVEWTKTKKWDQYQYNEDDKIEFLPDDLLIDFHNEMMGGSSKGREGSGLKSSEKTANAKASPNKTTDQQQEDEAESIKESFALHNEIAESLKDRLKKEMDERNALNAALSKAKTEKEKKEISGRLQDYSLRIIHIQSDIQSELDLAASYRTGEIVHTRTVFDDYARDKMINDMKVDAARRDATKQIADRIERQIRLLPEEQQEKARELAVNTIDGKTLASGDVEKARALAASFGKQIEGYAMHDQAVAEEAAAEAELKEAGAQAVIIAAGSITVGLGSSALVNAYGAEAAATIYGTKALGAVYGGVTGYLSGGPKAGAMQAASFWSPVTGSVASFVNGYYEAGQKKGATTSSQIWEGAKSAGTDYIVGKVFEIGVGVVAKSSAAVLGSESRLFKPLVKSPSQRSKEVLDMMRTSRVKLEAEDAVKSFKNLDDQLRTLQLNKVANSAKIQSLKKEMNQLAASMNADYHAKWIFKYKADPKLRNSFDNLVQENYKTLMPKMTAKLQQKGYDMSDISYKQFRNASSGGTSSMDLDLAPISKTTGGEPPYFLKNGKRVSAQEFMTDAQQAMNAEYAEMFGIGALQSEMNLTTSAHAEAFSTTQLLNHDVDFSQIAPEDIASIGKVLDVKVTTISNNPRYSETTKLQSKCREAYKEIDNMLLKKLRQDLSKAKPGSTQSKQIEADIRYWEDIGANMKKIGTNTNDPSEIIKINREIQNLTGGKDATQVVNDLINTFGFKK